MQSPLRKKKKFWQMTFSAGKRQELMPDLCLAADQQPTEMSACQRDAGERHRALTYFFGGVEADKE